MPGPKRYEVWELTDFLDTLQVITASEENDYSDIPGWEGEFVVISSKAIKLYFPKTSLSVWFPLSQLRIAEDKQSIYAPNWLLNNKGLG